MNDGYSVYSNGERKGSSDRWWTEDDPSSSVVEMQARLEQDQSDRIAQHLQYAWAYENQNLRSFYESGIAAGLTSRLSKDLGHRVTFNVVQACVDTAAAKIAKNRPRMQFLTSGGDHDEAERARNLTKFIDGLFYLSRAFEKGKKCFVDAGVFGTGLAKVYWDDDEATINVERVLPGEVFVDDTNAKDGDPRYMFQKKFVNRDILMERFGDDERKKIAIWNARGGDPGTAMRSIDMVPTIEAWHLPSGPKAKDGRHVIVIDGAVLVDEPWKRKYFPFATLQWVEKLVGVWGRGLAEMLYGIQQEINKLLERIQQSHHRVAVARVFMPVGSKVIKSHLNNEVGAIVEYSGDRPPTIDVSQAVPPELYTHLERLYAKAYEMTGISQLSATSKKPPGLNAGVALREYHDIESERFVLIGQQYENFFMDIARMMIDIARERYANNKNVVVRAPGTKFLEKISWKDVDLEEDAYVMKVYPTSILPTTPAGRLQKVQELHEAGFISRDQANLLLDFPDLEGTVSLQTAAIRDINRIIGNIVGHGKYETPEPFMNLKLAIQMAQSAYLRARNEGVPEGRLEKLRRFMDECNDLLNPPEDVSAPQGAPMEGPPAGPPGAPGALPPAPGTPPGMPPMSPFEPQPGAPLLNPLEAGSAAVPSMVPGGPV